MEKIVNFDEHGGVAITGDLVRCGECKYWMDIDNGRQKHEMCAQLMPNWFCADGKRREE